MSPLDHPGWVFRAEYLIPNGLSITEAAKALGVSRKALSEFVNGKSALSPEMAIRISKAFKTDPEEWMKRQIRFDLDKAKENTTHLKIDCLV